MRHCVKCGEELVSGSPICYSIDGDVAHALCPQDIKYCSEGHRLVTWINLGQPAPPCKCHPDHHAYYHEWGHEERLKWINE